jgi:two-component system, NarL family, sensor kinase
MESQNLILIFASGTFLVLLLIGSLIGFVVLHRNRVLRMHYEHKQGELEREKEVFNSLLDGEEKERKRISAELHDGLGARLSALKMEMEVEPNVPEYFVNRLNTAIDELREMSHNLQPDYLKKVGLLNAMRQHIHILNSHGVMHFLFSSPNIGDLKIGRHASIHIFRLFCELLNNVIKHADATKVYIQISMDEQLFILSIEDNGKGFEVSEKNLEKGIGLKSVYERTQLLEGSIRFDTNQGTLVTVQIPISNLTMELN